MVLLSLLVIETNREVVDLCFTAAFVIVIHTVQLSADLLFQGLFAPLRLEDLVAAGPEGFRVRTEFSVRPVPA